MDGAESIRLARIAIRRVPDKMQGEPKPILQNMLLILQVDLVGL